MARWTGDPNITQVLEAGAAWRERCLVHDGSLVSDKTLWTQANLTDLRDRYSNNSIEDASRDFFDKLREQLDGAPAATIQLAAEVLWILFLFPYPGMMKPSTKREAIQRVWELSGEPLPTSIYLDDAHMHGVGHPGTAYNTHRHAELEYLLRIMLAFKAMPPGDRQALLANDAPWGFIDWLDREEGSDRRLFRNALLYFLFPDDLERNLSKDHRVQIYEAFKAKLSSEERLRGKPKAVDFERAIHRIREILMRERETEQMDFYEKDIMPQWFTSYRAASTKEFTSWLNAFLDDRGLQLNQCGRDIKSLDDQRAVNPSSGFWENVSFVTSKPPRWLLHLDITGEQIVAKVPDQHRAGVIGFANTKGGKSAALTVRILPVMRTGPEAYRVIEHWEWLLLFCFPGGLEPGSSGEAFESFDPATGNLTYLKKDQPYIASALLCLNSPDDTVSEQVNGTMKTITYREATEALAKLIIVKPEVTCG